ncbi:MAG: pentapeptide repeat-containing protein [Leptolyngbyaceae cyanobacterium]
MMTPDSTAEIATVTELLKAYASGQRSFVSLNLANGNLKGVDLKGADLSYADLSEADLSNANLHDLANSARRKYAK